MQNLLSFTHAFILVLVFQGNAATKLRCGGKFVILVISYFLLILTVKEFLKSINICQSYSKNKSGPVFSDSQCTFCFLELLNRLLERTMLHFCNLNTEWQLFHVWNHSFVWNLFHTQLQARFTWNFLTQTSFYCSCHCRRQLHSRCSMWQNWGVLRSWKA